MRNNCGLSPLRDVHDYVFQEVQATADTFRTIMAARESHHREFQILHIEDSSMDADLIQYALARAALPVRIQVVTTKREFEKALEQEPPDLILSDSCLPGFNGQEALAQAQQKFPQVPFVFCSGYVSDERREQALQRGAADYLSKDDMPGLIARVRELLKIAQ
jgi:FOG: CheY-like receiver